MNLNLFLGKHRKLKIQIIITKHIHTVEGINCYQHLRMYNTVRTTVDIQRLSFRCKELTYDRTPLLKDNVSVLKILLQPKYLDDSFIIS